MSPADHAERLARLDRSFAKAIPFNAWLGLETVDFGDGEVTLRLPHDPKLVGDPTTGVLHGGVITAAMDAACGASVFLALHTPRRIATLDLRVDYLRPSEPGRDVFCRCRCHKVTKQVAFTEGWAFHDTQEDSIARVVGTFMVFDGTSTSVLADGITKPGDA